MADILFLFSVGDLFPKYFLLVAADSLNILLVAGSKYFLVLYLFSVGG